MRALHCLLLTAFVVLGQTNNRPIIGILTLPCDDDDCGSNQEYFPASYAKSVEQGGGRVVPVHYTDSPQDITTLLSMLNGVIFTGGGASLDDGSPYFAAVETVWNYVIQVNKNGDYYPLWGTCLGFQSICRACSQDENILTSFDSENYTIPLVFTSDAVDSSMFNTDSFGDISDQSYSYLSMYNITMNNHAYGVSPANFVANNNLNTFFNILSTNFDRENNEFVSLIEGKDFPVYGAQFHSEKPQFEWYPQEVIQHTREAILANAYFMQFFIDEARYNNHSFPTDVTPDLIYNYCPVFTDGEFTQCYYW